MNGNIEDATGIALLHGDSTEAHQLTLTHDFLGASPLWLYAYWTQPELICRWWPQEAVIDARVGGAYRLSWPKMGWVLRGRYTQARPGVALGFTWRWEHEPDDVTRDVALSFAALDDGGTRLTLVHGPYADGPEEAALRQSHLDGWIRFLGKLRTIVSI